MTRTFVADASMAIALIHPGQATVESDRWAALLSEGAEIVVPALWPLEVANVLLQLQKRRKLPAKDVVTAIELLQVLPIKIDHGDLNRVFDSVLALALSEKLCVYDATYLDLALRLKIPLATRDKVLRSAAERQDVVTSPT